ncbi:MAG TPA: hypothetical protein VL049_08375, partial [Candidatus Dormibacteraeota bacterium]|nr:hypothetical protein [Candidatus Dormibacteraeota bacterium]
MRTAIIVAFAIVVTASTAWAAPDQCPGFQGDGVPLRNTPPDFACAESDCAGGVGSALEEIAVQLCSLGVLPAECGRCECCRRPAIDLFAGTDVVPVGPGTQFCQIGGRGQPMGEAALCLLRDLANPALGSAGPGIQLERSASLAIGNLTVRQHVGFVDFDVPGRRMRGYHSATFCAPVLGCISNQTQPFTATLQHVDLAPEACRDYAYQNPWMLHVESEQLEHDVHIGIGPLTVYTPAGPINVEPSLDYEMNLEAVTDPWACCPGKRQPIACTFSDEYDVTSPSFGLGATLLAGGQVNLGRGWNAALGLGGRDPDPADPIWMPGPMESPIFPERPDFDFSIARSLAEKRPTGRFRTAVDVCYGVGDSCSNLISDLLGSFNIPPLSLEAFEVYVRSSLEAAFVSEFAIAFDEGKPD